jgi:hypothetical protein
MSLLGSGRKRGMRTKVRLWHFSDLVVTAGDVRSSVQSGPRRIHDRRGMGGTACSRNGRLWNARCWGNSRLWVDAV